MRTLVPGEWYILFTCSECETRQVLFPDLSQGRAKLRAVYKVACQKCGFRGAYDSDSLERYQHPADAAPLTSYGNAVAFFGVLWFGSHYLRTGGRARKLGLPAVISDCLQMTDSEFTATPIPGQCRPQ